MKRKQLVPLLLLLLLICGLFLGCEQKNNKKIRLLLDWLPNPNHIPLYVGLEKGFFQEEGIHLCIQKMHESGGGITYLTAKKADLLINHLPGTLKACEKGAKLKIIGVLIKEPLCGLICHKDPLLKQACDLTGKVLGYCMGIQDMHFLNFLLTQGQIKPSDKINVSVDLISAMGTHSVDFIYGGFWNIEPAQLKALGIETQTFKIQDLGVPIYYEMIILANAGSPQAHPSFILPFQAALQKSLNFCKNHPQEAFDCFLRYNPDRKKKTIAWQQEAWSMTLPLLANDQDIDEELVEKFYTWQLEKKIIENGFDYRHLIRGE